MFPVAKANDYVDGGWELSITPLRIHIFKFAIVIQHSFTGEV